MEAMNDERQPAELVRSLHETQDLLEIERERCRQLEWELSAAQIRCADALDAMASVMASVEVRLGKSGRALLSKMGVLKQPPPR